MKKSSIILLSGLILLASTAANSALITQYGDNLSFTYDDSTAYGTGFVIGDVIFFTPSIFLAESYDAEGLDTITATLNIDISATTDGYKMSSFDLYEDGDYRLDGNGASVSADGFFRATSLTTQCGLPPCQETTLFDAGTLTDTDGDLALWSMGGMLDLSWGMDSAVRLTIQNNLTAETLADQEIAFIQKKFSVTTTPEVPVPAAVWLFGSGILTLIGVARRRTQS